MKKRWGLGLVLLAGFVVVHVARDGGVAPAAVVERRAPEPAAAAGRRVAVGEAVPHMAARDVVLAESAQASAPSADELGRVRIRLVDADGRGIERARLPRGAQVWPHFEAAPGQWEELAPGGYGVEGEFNVRVRRAGRYVFVVECPREPRDRGRHGAAAIVNGNARSEVLELAPDGGPVEVELALMGAGVVRGEVVTGLGQPVGGLRLWLQPAELGEVDLWSRGAGLDTGVEVTDGEGRFAFPGLRAGAYDVYALDGVRLNAAPVEADGEFLRFTLALDFLVVRVFEASGAPCETVRVDGSSGGGSVGQGVLVKVVPDAEVGADCSGRVLSDRSAVFGGLVPGRYQVRVWSKVHGFLVRPFELIPGRGLQTLVIELPRVAPPGRLKITPDFVAGLPASACFAFSLTDRETGLHALSDFLRVDATQTNWVVPAGSYWLEVSYPAFWGSSTREVGAGQPDANPSIGFAGLALEVQSGRTSEQRVSLRPAAFVELSGGLAEELLLVRATRQGADSVAVKGIDPSFYEIFGAEGEELRRGWTRIQCGPQPRLLAVPPGALLLEVERSDGRRSEHAVDLSSGERFTLEL